MSFYMPTVHLKVPSSEHMRLAFPLRGQGCGKDVKRRLSAYHSQAGPPATVGQA